MRGGDQTTLFDLPPEPNEDAKALARRTDPETSKQAAEEILPKLEGLKAKALELVRENPGQTSRELSYIWWMKTKTMALADPRVVNRRLPELVRDGLVRKGKARECNRSGRKATTWFPVSSGPRYTERRLLDDLESGEMSR